MRIYPHVYHVINVPTIVYQQLCVARRYLCERTETEVPPSSRYC